MGELKMIYKPGIFRMATREGFKHWPYSASFAWGGHIFVVHHPNLAASHFNWIVSHRDRGLRVDFSGARTRIESRENALKMLEYKGRRRLLAAIRKAKALEGKEESRE